MSSVQRRSLLFGGAALAATAAAFAVSSARSAMQADSPDATGDVVVRWNSTTDSWAARPATAPFGVIFLSTNDANATPPVDPNNMVGDVWRRHPDAVAA